MTTIPYDTAIKVVEYMREQADGDVCTTVPYDGPLPPEIVETLHMLYHFGVLPARSQPKMTSDDIELAIFRLLGQEWVYDTLLEESFAGEFYRADIGRKHIVEAFKPYKRAGVPVELVTALLLVFSATYSRTTICALLGMEEPV
jgi:hypothetical protein